MSYINGKALGYLKNNQFPDLHLQFLGALLIVLEFRFKKKIVNCRDIKHHCCPVNFL